MTEKPVHLENSGGEKGREKKGWWEEERYRYREWKEEDREEGDGGKDG